MDLKLISCFLAAANELHFGRAANRLNILPSALGRNIKLLEEELGVRLFDRTTRNIVLTQSGLLLKQTAPDLLQHMEQIVDEVRSSAAVSDRYFRIGAIDTASTGLLPNLMHDAQELMPNVRLVLVEGKTVNLLPKLLSGALDMAFVRPPRTGKKDIEFKYLLNESTVVVIPQGHRLARRKHIRVKDLQDEPLIVPSPRNRPHSHNLTVNLFSEAKLQPNITQQVDEKQTIINMVAAENGLAIIPYWYTKLQVPGVTYKPLVRKNREPVRELPLAAAWVSGTRDPTREHLLEMLLGKLDYYGSQTD